SISPLRTTTCGCNSVVECQLPKLDVTGSNPVTRSGRKSNAEREISVPSDGRKCGPRRKQFGTLPNWKGTADGPSSQGRASSLPPPQTIRTSCRFPATGQRDVQGRAPGAVRHAGEPAG